MWAEDGEDELPAVPNPDNIGGWVWERAYLRFSMTPGKELPARNSALEGYLENNVQPLVEALEDIFEPTYEHHECFAYAMELFIDHERDGSPYAGGYYDQPASYIYVLDCVRSARDAAESYERQKEAHESFLKQQEAEEKARENNASGAEVY